MDEHDDIEDEIELLQVEIDKAKEAIATALGQQRARAKDSPLTAELKAAVVAAKEQLRVVEIKLRTLYESKNRD